MELISLKNLWVSQVCRHCISWIGEKRFQSPNTHTHNTIQPCVVKYIWYTLTVWIHYITQTYSYINTFITTMIEQCCEWVEVIKIMIKYVIITNIWYEWLLPNRLYYSQHDTIKCCVYHASTKEFLFCLS